MSRRQGDVDRRPRVADVSIAGARSSSVREGVRTRPSESRRLSLGVSRAVLRQRSEKGDREGQPLFPGRSPGCSPTLSRKQPLTDEGASACGQVSGGVPVLCPVLRPNASPDALSCPLLQDGPVGASCWGVAQSVVEMWVRWSAQMPSKGRFETYDSAALTTG
jgi:hypothetical protein